MYATILVCYVSISIERCPFVVICCLLTRCPFHILKHEHAAGLASKQESGEKHTGHVTSLFTLDVMTPLVVYIAKFVSAEVK